MLRKILKLLLLSFVFWLVAVVVLLGIFTFVPNQSPWLLPSAFTAMGIVGLAWIIAVVRQVLKWRT